MSVEVKKSIITGYLYPCAHWECRGTIIYPKKITLEDFKQAIEHWDEYYKKEHPEIREPFDIELSELKKELKNNRLNCGHIMPCNENEDYGLGRQAVDLTRFLEQFAGKKVRIMIEVVEE